jgi:hypothetical protein
MGCERPVLGGECLDPGRSGTCVWVSTVLTYLANGTGLWPREAFTA